MTSNKNWWRQEKTSWDMEFKLNFS